MEKRYLVLSEPRLAATRTVCRLNRSTISGACETALSLVKSQNNRTDLFVRFVGVSLRTTVARQSRIQKAYPRLDRRRSAAAVLSYGLFDQPFLQLEDLSNFGLQGSVDHLRAFMDTGHSCVHGVRDNSCVDDHE